MRYFTVLVVVSLVYANAFAQKKDGVIYTNDGVRHAGLVGTHKFNASVLKFKDPNTGEEKEFKKEDLCCWVIKGDSFTILKDITGKAFGKDKPTMKALPVIETGAITLYRDYVQHGTGPGSYGVINYIIQKDGQLQRLDQLHFIEQIANYVDDNPRLLDRIRHNELTLTNNKDDVPAIIKYYNDWKRMGSK